MKAVSSMFMKLPVMQCDEGCGKCCGIIPVTHEEFGAVRRFIRKNLIVPIDQGATCPFYQGGKCAVYDVRPVVCRMFGHSPKLVCPYGYNTNISREAEERINRRYGKPTRVLHELIDESKPLNMADLVQSALK